MNLYGGSSSDLRFLMRGNVNMTSVWKALAVIQSSPCVGAVCGETVI